MARKKKSELEYSATTIDDNLKDDTLERWKYYQQRYKAFNIDIENIIQKKGTQNIRYVGCFTYSNGINNIKTKTKNKVLPGQILLSGDIAFNFGKDKIGAFKRNISGLTDKTKERLDKVYNSAIDNKNCTLMPVHGSMNTIKGSLYFIENKIRIADRYGRPDNIYDRLDSFISLLEDFYNYRDTTFTMEEALHFIGNSVFKHTMNNENYTTLYSFLMSFESVYDYCKVFYGIDTDFVKELADNGRKPILKEDNLIVYMELAERFWRIQEDIYKENTK